MNGRKRASARRRITSYDVAQAAGVAQSTVSRCFQNAGSVSAETRMRIEGAARELGYTPNALARSLITQRSNLVGVVATRHTMRNNPDVVYAIGDRLAGAGKRLLLMVVANDQAAEAALGSALEFPLDGLISCVQMPDDTVRSFLHRQIPVLSLNRAVPHARVDCVVVDHAKATRQVATLLHQAGHRRFLCISGPRSAPVSRERVNGMLFRLSELGIADIPVISAEYSYEGGRQAMREQAPRMTRPDAIFCANDQLALGAMDACRFDLGWRVPDDVSVIGFDDIPEAARPGNALTTVRQDSELMATTAVELLLKRIERPDAAPQTIQVPTSLIRRLSARL
jgi:DNA-binding LacI/PurR family transcriptional regulator